MPPRPARLVLAALVAVLLLPPGAQARGPNSKAPTHADTPSEIHLDLAAQVRRSRLAGTRAVSPATTQEFLPTTWCGTKITTDDTEHSTLSNGQSYYKLVYAYASDQPDRFDVWKDVLQADVSLIGQYMALQDGATKAPRFDMGTSCGPDWVDIQVVHLPQTRAYYADQMLRIRTDVGTQLGSASGPRNVVVLADGLTNEPAGSLYGLGESYVDDADVAGEGNPHNYGDLYAALFPTLGYNPAGSAFWPEGMLHEITHTLGAVNDSAPHATGHGHCIDGSDVMCYDDGGTLTGSYSTSACSLLANSQPGMAQTYDCNHDDYFSPNPVPGSYLDTHWNVFNSDFEAPCPTIGAACGSAGATVPVNIDAPRALGAAEAGYTLTGDHGTWSATPDSFSYQWQRTPIGDGTPVDVVGATGPTYALGASDVGRRVRLVVVASNASGDSVPASSALSPTITPAFQQPSTSTPVAPGPVVQQPADVFKSAIVSLKRRSRTILKLRVTTRTTASGLVATASGLVATIPGKRVKVARRGTYRLTLCGGFVCITKTFRARHGKAKLPTIVVATRTPGAVTLNLIGPGGRASAKLP
jgi:hypothetical protein